MTQSSLHVNGNVIINYHLKLGTIGRYRDNYRLFAEVIQRLPLVWRNYKQNHTYFISIKRNYVLVNKYYI